jgi:hypothetical protein
VHAYSWLWQLSFSDKQNAQTRDEYISHEKVFQDDAMI